MKYQIDGNAHWPGSIYSAMLLGGDYSIIASSLYFDYLFSDYDIDKDEGTEYAYREGVPDGTRLYYVKIWDDLHRFLPTITARPVSLSEAG